VKIYRVAAFVFFALSADAAVADCTTPVKDAFEKLRTSKSFRMETKIVNPQGKLSMTVDYMPPDRMHQKIRLDDSPQEMELIVIGEQAWSNQGQGWVPLPKNFSEEVSKQVKTTLAGATKVEASYACKTEETMDGKKVAAYEAELKVAPADEKVGAKPNDKPEASGPANKQTLYVDTSTGLPLRNIVTDGKDPSKRLFDGWFRTAADISIEPPATP
jgi:hypothetical protein